MSETLEAFETALPGFDPASLPADPQLPQLGAVLDPQRMGEDILLHIQPRGSARYRMLGSAVERVQYKAGRNCLVVYRIGLRDETTGATFEQVFCGRAYARGGSRERFDHARTMPVVAPRVGPPVLHLEHLDMVLWAFPNERKLTGLGALCDEAVLRAEVLPEVVRGRWGDHARIDCVDVKVAHYFPEHALSVRVALGISPGGGTPPRSWVIYGKSSDEVDGSRVFGVMRALGGSDNALRGLLRVPHAIAYQPRYRVLWQEGLDGSTLDELAGSGAIDLGILAGAGACVAALHLTPIGPLPGVTAASTLGELPGRIRIIVAARPALAAMLHRIAVRLAQRSGELDTLTATLHGDLHPKNLFVEEDRIALIDLDGVCRGAPAREVGSFLAALYYRALLLGRPLAEATAGARAFVSAYRARVPWPLDDAGLAWYTAAALVNERASRCVTRLKTGRIDLLEPLVGLADRVSVERSIWRIGDVRTT